MNSRTDRPASNRGSTIAAVLLAILPLIYVMSYAPLYRWMHGGDLLHAFSSVWHHPHPAWWETPYEPVFFITDHTPLDTPLLWWADVWGVKQSMMMDRKFRDDDVVYLFSVP